MRKEDKHKKMIKMIGEEEEGVSGFAGATPLRLSNNGPLQKS